MRDTVTSDVSFASGFKAIQKNLDLEELVMPDLDMEEKKVSMVEN